MANINDTYFDGYYREIWRSLIPEHITKAEVDFLIESAKLTDQSKVLDVMCGYGRHALAFARKGISVTAVDNLADYITEIETIAKKETLPVACIQKDILQLDIEGYYDLAICMGNSLCFFDEDHLGKIFQNISSHLTKGGKFIFNSWMIAEIVLRQFKEKSWSYVGDLKLLTDSVYLFSPPRVETESTIISLDGKVETKKAIDYIYSINETEKLLLRAGLTVKETWSIPGRKKFTLGESRVYIVAERQH